MREATGWWRGDGEGDDGAGHLGTQGDGRRAEEFRNYSNYTSHKRRKKNTQEQQLDETRMKT